MKISWEEEEPYEMSYLYEVQARILAPTNPTIWVPLESFGSLEEAQIFAEQHLKESEKWKGIWKAEFRIERIPEKHTFYYSKEEND